MNTIDSKPKARIKITLACDRACEYCINKCPEYRDRWVKISDTSQVKWSDFRTIIISGGEPTTDMRLRRIARDLRIFSNGTVPIYLQTNGWMLTKSLVKEMDDDIDGIGVSIHSIREFSHMIVRLADISRIKPIRLYVQDSKYHEAMDAVQQYGHRFSWRVWMDGEFDRTEKIFLLTGWQTTPVLTMKEGQT